MKQEIAISQCYCSVFSAFLNKVRSQMHRNRNENKSNKALDISKLLLNIVKQKVKNKYPV